MKKLAYLFLIFILGSFGLSAQTNSHNLHILDPYNPAYDTGVLLVKFKDQVDIIPQKSSDGVLNTGFVSVDEFFAKHEVYEMEQVFKNAKKQSQKKSFVFGGETHEVPQIFNIYKIRFKSEMSTEEMALLFQDDPLVEYAEPDFFIYSQENGETADVDPNDPLYQDGSQSYLEAINAPEAWQITTGDSTQIIGIIDTGVDWDHPDLDDNIWTNWDEIPDNGIDDDGNGFIDDVRGWDFVNDDNDPNDDNSHGTHVAGIAAAEGDNGIGIVGVAFNAKIMPIKMLQSSGSGNSSDLAASINYAADNGATVINMSLGSYGESLTVKTALENAYAGTGDGEGSILVAAAGNDHLRVTLLDPCGSYGLIPHPMFPASYSWVIGVMAEDAGPCDGFSNWDFDGTIAFDGFNYEIQAKGVGIMSCKPNGTYWNKSGTSMASPEVAGAIALMRNHQPDQSGEEIFAKLIQAANAGTIDIESSLLIDLQADLLYVNYEVIDTIGGSDEDAHADAGETIQLIVTIKNAGGSADSVWAKLRFREFEDPTTATIIDSISLIGSISSYGQLENYSDPFLLEINQNVVHNRIIVFEIDVYNKNQLFDTKEIHISIQNGLELNGIIDEDITLTADKAYYVTGNLVISNNSVITIQPGVQLLVDDGKTIRLEGKMNAIGKVDSLIEFKSSNQNWGGFKVFDTLNLEYCKISGIGGYNINYGIFNNFDSFVNMRNCIYIDNTASALFFKSIYYYDISIKNCIFTLNGSNNGFIAQGNGSVYTYKECLIVNNYGKLSNTIYFYSDQEFKHNVLFKNGDYSLRTNSSSSFHFEHPIFLGYLNELSIQEAIYDYFDDGNYGVLYFDSISDYISPHCHGIVWKVKINETEINRLDHPYNSPTGLGVVGAETLKFDVYFNRAMDISYDPLLTYGVREPYTQHIIADNATWSADSTVYTAYATIDETTGDGIQRVRVANAKDNERFEIPIEDSRFEFVIQAAGAASIEFVAIPGIGKIDLEWPESETDDALGYNMYSYYNLTDSTFSDTLRINPELILDTIFTDFEVIPDTTYHYLFTTIGTDMQETDYSKQITAVPLSAANGDANGSMDVNVLDITTIVNYMLGLNPEPFLIDAADVNYDGNINVLDIIGVVQIIQGKKSVPLSNKIGRSQQVAWMQQKGKNLILESKGNVAALYFELQGKNLEDLKLYAKAEGFELAMIQSDTLVKGIMFSLSGKTIEEGETLLITASKEVENCKLGRLEGGDWDGLEVPILKLGESIELVEPNELEVFPNPFKGFATIQYQLAEKSAVQIKVYQLNGQLVDQLDYMGQESGAHQLNWGEGRDKGVYLFQVEVKSANESWKKEVKLIHL